MQLVRFRADAMFRAYNCAWLSIQNRIRAKVAICPCMNSLRHPRGTLDVPKSTPNGAHWLPESCKRHLEGSRIYFSCVSISIFSRID